VASALPDSLAGFEGAASGQERERSGVKGMGVEERGWKMKGMEKEGDNKRR